MDGLLFQSNQEIDESDERETGTKLGKVLLQVSSVLINMRMYACLAFGASLVPCAWAGRWALGE